MLIKDWKPWRRSYFVDPPTPDGGGNGGGGGAPPAEPPTPTPPATPDPAAPTPPATPPAPTVSAEEFNEMKEAVSKLSEFQASAMEHLEIDASTGKLKPKEIPKAPTREELQKQMESGATVSRAVQLVEQNRRAEEKITSKFKGQDPLFDKNIAKAKELIDTLVPEARTEASWSRAYDIARGQNVDEAVKIAHENGKAAALKEFSKQSGASVPSGGSGAPPSGESKVDLSKVVLSPEQFRAAQKSIDAGLVKNIDEYKENLVYLGTAEVLQ